MLWPCRKTGQNKGTEKAIKIKIYKKQNYGMTLNKGQDSQVVGRRQVERKEVAKESEKKKKDM